MSPSEGDTAPCEGDAAAVASPSVPAEVNHVHDQTQQRSRKSTRRVKRRKREAEERQRIDAAMRLIDDAKAKAGAERTEYGKYLAWKVSMQRKERANRHRAEALRVSAVEESLTQLLQEHRAEVAEKKRQWRQFADNRTVSHHIATQDTPGDTRHQAYVEERRQLRQARQAESRALVKTKAVVQPNDLAPREPSHSAAPRATYEDFIKGLSDDALVRRTDTDKEWLQQGLEDSQRRREGKMRRVETMYELAGKRRVVCPGVIFFFL